MYVYIRTGNGRGKHGKVKMEGGRVVDGQEYVGGLGFGTRCKVSNIAWKPATTILY